MFAAYYKVHGLHKGWTPLGLKATVGGAKLLCESRLARYPTVVPAEFAWEEDAVRHTIAIKRNGEVKREFRVEVLVPIHAREPAMA